MKKVLFLFSIGLLTIHVVAQNNYCDVVNITYSSYDKADWGDSLSLTESGLDISLGYSFPINEKGDELSLAFVYSNSSYDFGNTSYDPIGVDLLGGMVELASSWKNPYWGSTVDLGFYYSGVGKPEASTVYQADIAAMIHYGKSDRFILTGGLYYSVQPFGFWLFPMVGFDSQVNDKLYFSMMIFDYTYLEYELLPNKLYTGLENRSVGISTVIDDWEGEKNSYLTSLSNQFPYFPTKYGMFVDYYFGKYFAAFAKFGWIGSRGFEHGKEDGGLVANSPFNVSPEGSLYFDLGVALRVRN